MIEWAEWGYAGLFAASFLAATVLPFSSEALLSAMVWADYPVAYCIAVASAGNWLGGMTGYYLGAAGKWEWLEKYFKISPDKMNNWQQRIQTYGSTAAFFCWLPGVGDFIAVALGFFRASAWKTAIWMALGKALRYLVWAAITLKVQAWW